MRAMLVAIGLSMASAKTQASVGRVLELEERQPLPYTWPKPKMTLSRKRHLEGRWRHHGPFLGPFLGQRASGVL
jgi:hypothetical protein